jgi:hypothetical protein
LFRDGIRESVIVAKTFDVKVIESDHSPTEENENRFLYEVQQEKKVDLKSSISLK